MPHGQPELVATKLAETPSELVLPVKEDGDPGDVPKASVNNEPTS